MSVYSWNDDSFEPVAERHIGDILPDMSFPIRVRDESIGGDNPYRWDTMRTIDEFKGRRVVIFSLPGAFTPTCSTMQVPSFEEKAAAGEFANFGIDDVYCVSVNDSYVMNSWARALGLEYVKVIPDGTGEFTQMMGMLVDKANLGFGLRSWRYAMIVNNGTVEAFFLEPGMSNNCEDDPYGETSPDVVLAWLQAERDADNALRVANGEQPL